MAGAAICPPAPASAGHADAPRAVGGREAQPAGPSPPSVSMNAGPWGWPCSQTLVTPKSSPGQHRSLQLQAKVQVPKHHNVDVLKEGARPGLFPRDPEHTPAVRRNPRDSPPPRRSGLPPPPPAEEGQPFSGTVQPASSEECHGPARPLPGVGRRRAAGQPCDAASSSAAGDNGPLCVTSTEGREPVFAHRSLLGRHGTDGCERPSPAPAPPLSRQQPQRPTPGDPATAGLPSSHPPPPEVPSSPPVEHF